MGLMTNRGERAHSSRYHAQPRTHAQPWWWLWLAFAGSAPAADDHAARDPHDTVIARASEAWQAEDGDTMYFSGDLQLRGSLWRISAERARVEGKLEDPDLIVVDGDPARIVVGPDSAEPIEGRCQHLEFEPHSETLRLVGGAMVAKGQQSVSSETIKYLVRHGSFTAGSVGRVKVVTQPHRK